MTVLVELDSLWAALLLDLRRNASGDPTGREIIARYRYGIEAKAREVVPPDDAVRLREALEAIAEARPLLDANCEPFRFEPAHLMQVRARTALNGKRAA